MNADVVIIGGGCMGASVAYHLTRLGITSVVLVERDPQLGAGSTARNAGGVRHQFSQPANVQLSIESIRLFEQFEEVVGSPIDFHQDGYLFLLSESQHVEAFRNAVDMQRGLGVPVEWLDADEAAALAPGLGIDGVVAATFCGRDGICDPNGVTMGFAAAARRAGVQVRKGCEVTGIAVSGGRVTGVETSQGPIHSRIVVNATGAWAAGIGAMADVSLPIAPLRRHIFIAAPPTPDAWPSSRIMVIDFATSFYFHREGANLLFGMGDPDERESFDLSVNWNLLGHIAPVAARRMPALADASILKAWAGLYEMTPDAMPIIGPTGPEGLYTIAGFSGHGFQHSPAAGRIVADLIGGRDPQWDPAPFSLGRFDRRDSAGQPSMFVEGGVV